MYNSEFKQEIIELFENYSLSEISNMKSISLSTLYRWKKELNSCEAEYDSVKEEIKQADLNELEVYEKQFSNNKKIQNLIVSQYIKYRKYDNAMEICEKFQFDEYFQSQLVTIYIKQGLLDKAIEICKKFQFDEYFQSQLVTIYIKQGLLDKAIEICENFQFDEYFQSQLVKIFIETEQFEEAIVICNKFPQNKYIQNQLITIYIATKQFNKALQICNKFPLDDSFQSQLVKIFIETEQFEEAIEICNKFPKHEYIQNQLVSIYIKLGKTKDATEICERYPNNKYFQKKLDFVREKEIEISKEILTNIRLRILSNEINNEDLKKLETIEGIIDNNIYKFVRIAIFHRLGMIKNCLQTLKTIDQKYNKIKNKLFNILSNKRTSKYYEIIIYDEIINWNDDTKNVEEEPISKTKKLLI